MSLYKSYIKAVSILSIITGMLVITGWFTGNENLKSVITGLPTMKFNTAICFILSSTALFLLTKKIKKHQFFIISIAVIVILISAITFTQTVFSYDTGLDEMLVKDIAAKVSGDAFPGRMATTTTFCFLLCAFAFIAISSGKKKLQVLAQYALHTITIATFTAIIGYLFNVPEFHRLSFLTSMALNTSILFFLISIAASLINFSLGVTGMFTGKSLGSIMARKLFPLTALTIIVLGYLRMQLHWHNLVEQDFGIALFATSFLLVSLVVISLNAKYLNTVEEKRSRAEEELKILAKTESEQKLQLALTSLGDNVWEHDFITQKTIFTNTNKNLAAFRNDGVQNIEQLWWNSILAEDWYLLQENDRKYKAGIIDRHALEYRLLHKDGTIKWVLDRGVVIEKDSAGKPLKIIGTHTDITDRKNAEADLNKMQKQFQAFMHHTPAMAWIVDKKSVYQFTNANYLKTFYKDNSEGNVHPQLVGKSFYELFPQEIAAKYKSNNDIVFNTNKILETIESSINKDGSSITLKVFKFPLQISDDVTLLGGIAIDITEHIKAEENLRVLNEQLTTSNKELEQFAYVASHDLQEPLRMVSSFMQLFEKKYKPQLDETAKQYINFAVDGAERMKTLILDLLSFSRIGTEKQINDNVDLNVIIKEVKLNLAASITESNAKIKADTFPVIQANKIQMLQLFQNLISNAIKYRSERTPEIEIGYNDESTHYIFYVKDNGIGIDNNYFEKIFIIFQRLHTKTAYPGTGVGLSICKKIVEKHGGKFTVESEPGTGSIFNFSIPKKQKS